MCVCVYVPTHKHLLTSDEHSETICTNKIFRLYNYSNDGQCFQVARLLLVVATTRATTNEVCNNPHMHNDYNIVAYPVNFEEPLSVVRHF